ncbi:hypothetical protein FDECE_13854 [Fusarium decemcellulare]|nr:hypothetical protein FDECE_13854 [Fusarium decemcellulare]
MVLIYSLVLLLRVAPSVTHTVESVSQGRRTSKRPSLEPPRQHHAERVHGRDQYARAKGHEAVEDCAGINVATQALPLDSPLGFRQRRRREPTNRQTQRQRVPNDQLACEGALQMAQGTRAVGDGRVEHAAIVRPRVMLRCAVQQNIHVGADVHVAQLKCTSEGEDERNVFAVWQLLADDLVPWRGAGGQTTGQGRIGVDVELEEV